MTHPEQSTGQLERRRSQRREGESRGVLVRFSLEGGTDWSAELEAELLDMSEVGIAFCIPRQDTDPVEEGTTCRLELGRDPEHRIRFEGPIVRRIEGERLAYALEIQHVQPLGDDLDRTH